MRIRTIVDFVIGLRTVQSLAFLTGHSFNLSLRLRHGIRLSAIVLAIFAARPASAQTGVIAFRDDCTDLLYAMRGDGSGREATPQVLDAPPIYR